MSLCFEPHDPFEAAPFAPQEPLDGAVLLPQEPAGAAGGVPPPQAAAKPAESDSDASFASFPKRFFMGEIPSLVVDEVVDDIHSPQYELRNS